MNYHWNWGIFWEISPDGVHTYFDLLMRGLGWTLIVSAASWVLAFVAGSFIGVIRTLPSRWLVHLGNSWIEFFRDIPLLVQLFLWFFVLPELLPVWLGDWIKQSPNSVLYTSILGIGFFMSARVAIQVTAGINAVPPGQGMAAASLGLTRVQAYGQIILPQAYRIVFPPLTSELLSTIKNSTVALTLGLVELTASARAMQEYSNQVFEAFTVAAIIYLLINIVVTLAMHRLERSLVVPGFNGGAP